MKKTKKMLSFVLSMLLIVTMFPTMALFFLCHLSDLSFHPDLFFLKVFGFLCSLHHF